MKRLPSDRGAAAVEFALVMPVLLMLVVGIAEFGRAYNVQTTLSGAAREGVRVMAVENDPAAARAATKSAALPVSLTDSQISVSPAECVSTTTATASATVTVTYGLQFITGTLRYQRHPARQGNHAMQRLGDERGAVSVVVALLMVALIGLAAVSLDVAGLWAKRQQLQIGADAGALAIAQDCGRGNCGSPGQTAQSLAELSINDGTVTATLLNSVTSSSGTVTVQTSGVRQHLFAPILGVNQTTVTAQATAAWGAPTSGIAALPLAFSWCEFQAQTGGGTPL